MRHAVSQAYDAVMNCWVAQSVVVLACVLTCQPSIYAQALVVAGNPEGQHTSGCLASSTHEVQPGPELTVAELIFEGDLRMPVSDQDEIAAFLNKWRTGAGRKQRRPK